MDIRIEKKARIEAMTKAPSAGGVRVYGEADLEVDQITGTLMLEVFSVDAVAKLELPPEDIERAGLLVQALRRKVGDLREICVEHGYYDAKPKHYDCPLCGRNATAVTEAPKPSEIGQAIAEVCRPAAEPL